MKEGVVGVADGQRGGSGGGWVLLCSQLSLDLFKLEGFPWQSHGRLCVHFS